MKAAKRARYASDQRYRDWQNSYDRRYRRANPERAKAYKLLRRYGVTMTEYKSLLVAQGGTCGICLSLPDDQLLYVDHDHGTGEVRGLLCRRCNFALGQMRDDEQTLLNAVDYLRRTRKKP